jgi:hypothetical protein
MPPDIATFLNMDGVVHSPENDDSLDLLVAFQCFVDIPF